MKKGITSTGFRYQFEEKSLDDMRFVDVLATVVDEKSSILDKLVGTSKLLTMILGEDQKEALYDHIGKSNEGRVPREDLEKALEEIMLSAGDGTEKNS